jgi:5-methylcytosine-specific restriction endonuclease McrA
MLFNMDANDSVTEAIVKLCSKGHPMTPGNTAKNGKYTTCKTCKKASQEAWKRANPEKAKESHDRASLKFRRTHGIEEGNANARKTHCPEGHEYTEENTYRHGPEGQYRMCQECRRAHVRASYRRHREERLAYMKARYAANPEVYNEYCRRWQQENRERSNLLSRIKKQRRRAAGTLTVADWELVLEVYGHACLACGKPEVTIDHVVPVSCGGPNDITNVQPLCGYCNTSKGAKTIDYRPEPWAALAEQADAESAA